MHYSTMKRVLTSLFLFCTPFISLQSGAESAFSVQVGAYKSVSEELLSQLESFGAVNTEPNASITRVTVGSLGSWSEAKALLAQLQNEGFSDAFIRKSAGTHGHPHSTTTATAAPSHITTRSRARSTTKLDALPPEDRPFAVYVDGALYLKRGDQFIPVD